MMADCMFTRHDTFDSGRPRFRDDHGLSGEVTDLVFTVTIDEWGDLVPKYVITVAPDATTRNLIPDPVVRTTTDPYCLDSSNAEIYENLLGALYEIMAEQE